MKAITKLKTFSETIRTEPLVLVDFFTEWCGPCNMMKPILEELKSALGDRARILKVDVEKRTLKWLQNIRFQVFLLLSCLRKGKWFGENRVLSHPADSGLFLSKMGSW